MLRCEARCGIRQGVLALCATASRRPRGVPGTVDVVRRGVTHLGVLPQIGEEVKCRSACTTEREH